jgi:hypothetical protein
MPLFSDSQERALRAPLCRLDAPARRVDHSEKTFSEWLYQLASGRTERPAHSCAAGVGAGAIGLAGIGA